VSLSACSSTNGTSATSTTNTTIRSDTQPQSLVPFPDNSGVGMQPTATPDLPNQK
jgi:hypothetical protein